MQLVNEVDIDLNSAAIDKQINIKPLAFIDTNVEISESGLREATDQYQRKIINAVLEQERGNLAATARILKLDRSNLIRSMRRLGL